MKQKDGVVVFRAPEVREPEASAEESFDEDLRRALQASQGVAEGGNDFFPIEIVD